MKKIPWGILAGSFIMLCSFLTIAIVAVFVVSTLMIQEVGSDDGLRESWWLSLIIVIDIISFLSFIASFIFYIKKEKELEGKIL